jgi:transcriptional regulator with XRE-family HTH domain
MPTTTRLGMSASANHPVTSSPRWRPEKKARSTIQVMSNDERQAAPATDRETQLASDYELIRSGGPGWHLAFKRFRLALGVGQKTIAKRMGIHPTAITKWEHGRSEPSRETRERALAAMGWTPSAPPLSESPTKAPVRETPRVVESEYLPEAPVWEPPRYTPSPRRHRSIASLYLSLLTGQRQEEEDPNSPYFVSK